MDGAFVPNLSFGPDAVALAARVAPGLPRNVHLMLRRPDLLLDAFAKAGYKVRILEFQNRAGGRNWSLVLRFACAALVCGLCWETWNYYAVAKWVYAVPFVHRFQIWEMPLIGFAGYLPFGVECAAVTAWICPDLIEADA